MDSLLKEMTLKQKAGQLNQKLYGWECYTVVDGEVKLSEKLKEHILEFDGIGAIYGLFRADPWSNINFENGLNYNQAVKLINLIRTFINDNCSLPIMPLIVEEMPHGHQGLNANCYPTNIAVGASFNPDLYGLAIKEQHTYANNHHINVGLISGLDVARDSRWGRTEETFGSDPYLSSTFTAQIAKNFKGSKAVACLKHFAAQGAPYMGLNSGAVNIGVREFREIHLKPTAAAADYGFDLVMAAYNEIDGVPCHANKKLLTTILRDELKFDGIVMADGMALNRLVNQNVEVEEAARMAIEAGVGLSLWDDVFTNLDVAVEKGIVSQELLDLRVAQMLNLKSKLGLLEYSVVESNLIDQTDDINYRLACESIILQKNTDEYFPVTSDEKILFISNTFDSLYTFLGDYTAFQNTDKYRNLREIIEAEMVNSKCMTIEEADTVTLEELKTYNKIIVVGGGTSSRDFGMEFEANGALKFGDGITDSGENIDLGQITLKQNQYNICQKLKELNIDYGFICVQGRPYALKHIAVDAKAIISCYYNGQLGPVAIFDTILGKVNPSGKNPISMPDYPEYFGFEYNSKQDKRNENYVDRKSNMFEFGHGLSYSKVEYQDAILNNNKLIITVRNNSDLDCKEVVQVYIKKENSIIVKRRRELVAFQKVDIPANSESVVEFQLASEWFETIGLDMQPITEKGNYVLIVGTGLESYFEVNFKKS